MTSVRFDDIESLQALVSDALLPLGPPIEITFSMVDAFAELTGDRQWIHVDVERCRRDSPLGAPIAHGMLLVSLTIAQGQQSEPHIVGFGQAIHYGVDALRFMRPVAVGSSIAARRRVVHVRKKGVGGSQLSFETEVLATGSEQPVLRYRSTVVFLP